MNISEETIATERSRLTARSAEYVAMINETRDALGLKFDQDIDRVTEDAFRNEVKSVFVDPDRAINVAGLLTILRDLDVTEDHPAFIVDEVLGRQLAATIAGGQPAATLAEATFHFIDIEHRAPDTTAGWDDLEAGVAAGFQTRLPGWPWQGRERPFDSSP